MNKLQFYKNIRAINLVIIFFQAKLIEDSNIFNLLNKRTKCSFAFNKVVP